MNTQATVTPATNSLDNSIPANAPAEAVKPEFGSGRYSVIMAFCFNEAVKILSMTPKGAELFARRVGSQVGVQMKNVSYETNVKIGRTSAKAGTLTVSEALKGSQKGIESTPELQLAHALQWWCDAGKHGFSYSRSTLQLTEALADSVKAIELDAK